MGMFFSITTNLYFNMFVKSHAVVHDAIHLATHGHAIEAYLDLRLPYIKQLVILVCHGLITICMYIQVPCIIMHHTLLGLGYKCMYLRMMPSKLEST